MDNDISIQDFTAAERDAHAVVSAALRNADGLDADKRAARLIAIERGLDGDDSNQVNERLSHE